MKKYLFILLFAIGGLFARAQEVIVMDKAMFIEKVFDYTDDKATGWTYKGDRPAIIDLYADWCGPCRRVAPVMKELAALFNATSIPLFVLVPTDGMPRLFSGAADKATYIKAIDEFLLKGE